MDKKFNFQELQAIVATLRGENGCPWDKSQTHESLKLYTLEEAYEVNQAVTDLTKTGDCANLKEELGDLLFQVLLQSQVAEDNGEICYRRCYRWHRPQDDPPSPSCICWPPL